MQKTFAAFPLVVGERDRLVGTMSNGMGVLEEYMLFRGIQSLRYVRD